MVTIQHAPELLKENSLQASDSTELKIIVKVKEEPHVLRSETTRTPRRGAVCTQDLRYTNEAGKSVSGSFEVFQKYQRL